MKILISKALSSTPILVIIFCFCSDAPAKQDDNTTINQEISQIRNEKLTERKVLPTDKQLNESRLNDSLFETNPAGFIIGHSENPSWDVAYILFENGNLVY